MPKKISKNLSEEYPKWGSKVEPCKVPTWDLHGEKTDTVSASSSSISSCTCSECKPAPNTKVCGAQTPNKNIDEIDDLGEYMKRYVMMEQNKGGFLEITLTHPLTKDWVSKTTVQQKKWYIKVWSVIRPSPEYMESSDIRFEYHLNGHVHAHCIVEIYDDADIVPIGLIADTVKSYLRYMPKKYDRYCEKNMHVVQKNYTCPMICVNYRTKNEKDHQTGVPRKSVWIGYMCKSSTNDW